MKKIITLALLVLTSCAHFVTITTKQELINRRGYPDKVVKDNDLDVYVYYYTKSTSGYMGNGFTHTRVKHCQSYYRLLGDKIVDGGGSCN